MAFLNAMDSRITGANGALALATTGSALLDLHQSLVRGLDHASLDRLFEAALKEATELDAKADLVVLAFMTRAARGEGKGEKALFYRLLHGVWTHLGIQTVVAVLPLVAHYGYWRDLLSICALPGVPAAIEARCLSLFAEALRADEIELAAAAAAGRTPKLSLCGKWAPREHSAFDKKPLCLAAKLAAALFGGASPSAARRKYRQLVAALNTALNTTEVKMAAGRWAEIQFAEVASACLARHRKAFLNEQLRVLPGRLEQETGNRRPADADRVEARRHLRAAMAERGRKGGGVINGRALLPHEIVTKCMLHREQLMVLAALGDGAPPSPSPLALPLALPIPPSPPRPLLRRGAPPASRWCLDGRRRRLRPAGAHVLGGGGADGRAVGRHEGRRRGRPP